MRSAHPRGCNDRMAGTDGWTGASRSRTPRSDRRIAVVAVTIFVMENHGMAVSVVIGSPGINSAVPMAERARIPSGPTTTTATPGALPRSAAATRSSRSLAAIVPPCDRRRLERSDRSQPTHRRSRCQVATTSDRGGGGSTEAEPPLVQLEDVDHPGAP
jgi:hypothetical protein